MKTTNQNYSLTQDSKDHPLFSNLEIIFCAFLAENDFVKALIRFIRFK